MDSASIEEAPYFRRLRCAIVSSLKDLAFVKLLWQEVVHRQRFKAVLFELEHAFYLASRGDPNDISSDRILSAMKYFNRMRPECDNVEYTHLVKQLQLLVASKLAGKTGHNNEITAILNELQDCGSIPKELIVEWDRALQASMWI